MMIKFYQHRSILVHIHSHDFCSCGAEDQTQDLKMSKQSN